MPSYSFNIHTNTLADVDALYSGRSAMFVKAIAKAIANPADLGLALCRRATGEPHCSTKKVCITGPDSLKDDLDALSTQMSLSLDMTMRLALEALVYDHTHGNPEALVLQKTSRS